MVTYESLLSKEDKIAVIGLGYVGLPLAVQLAKHFKVVGYDLKKERVEELKAGKDRTLEVSDAELKTVDITYSSDPHVIKSCRLVIVAVPTPIDEFRIPDLKPLKGACEISGQYLSKGSCVVFESTVYPGTTEEVCVPILEAKSKLTFGKDFTVGYSPERINPGDKEHTVETIIKVVSGSDNDSSILLKSVYGKIVTAGIHMASSIKVAEAAKVIENTQRDLNIALMNELSMIFDIMGINTLEVLEAAGTKWNFLPFKPGLVGGHCIGVDPYYLTFKAESMGYHPEMILAGRRINDNMGKYLAEKTVKLLISEKKQVKGAKVAVLGITFKEDVPDLRNTKVVDIMKELEDYGIDVIAHDPLADPIEAKHYYGLDLKDMSTLKDVDAIVLAVKHKAYLDMGIEGIKKLFGDHRPIIVDVKGAFRDLKMEKSEIIYWEL